MKKETEIKSALIESQSDEQLWQQLTQYVELYQFYWGIALKLMIFTMGLIVAVATYCIKNHSEVSMAFALILPFLLCVFCSGLSYFSLPSLKLMRAECAVFGRALKLTSVPDFSALILFSRAVNGLFGLTAIGLFMLFVLLLKL